MDAVLPLIGVVLGAVIGAAMTFLLDRRREGRAARAGVRLVVDELQGIRSTWQTLTEGWSKTPTAETADWVISNLQGQPLSTRQWKHAQELLAASLPDDDWTALATIRFATGIQRAFFLRDGERAPAPAAVHRARLRRASFRT